MALTETVAPVEDIDSFRQRARAWLPEHLSKIGAKGDDDVVGKRMVAEGLDPGPDPDDADKYFASDTARGRVLSQILFEGGFAGITYPKDCGGQGLPLSYLHAFNDEARAYDFSSLRVFGMTLGMIGPTIAECGTAEQKAYWIPRMLRGEDVWVQFLSEPTGGSDLAGAITRADRDGDEFVINGSKIWTSLAEIGDMGMMVARTNWDVPKHRGLSVFLVPVRAEGVEVIPLRLVSGGTGFCQEFFTDVHIPAANLLGELNDGWTVASRLLVHERNSVGGGSQYHQIPSIGAGGGEGGGGPMGGTSLVELAKATGQTGDDHVRQIVAEAHVLGKVGSQLGPRIGAGTRKGHFPPASGSFLKLFNTTNSTRIADIEMAIAGSPAVVWKGDDAADRMRGVGYLSRQTGSILSGTSEIQRNIISERVLDLPREAAPDREAPFNQVRTNKMPGGKG